MPTRQHIRELQACLTGDGATPSIEAIALGRRHWLGAWLYHRLESADLPTALRAALASDFATSFTRRTAITAAWQTADAALAEHGVSALTLGALPYADQLYPHAACKTSQDVDLLVDPDDLPRAVAALRAGGFHQIRGHGIWRIVVMVGGQELQVELDLHTTPGEEARNPALRGVYGASTSALLAGAEPWSDWRGLTTGATPPPDVPEVSRGFGAARRLSVTACLDNRVVHFFKHHCQPLRHGLELPLLMSLPHDPASLSTVVATNRTGRIWAFVLALLGEWGCTGLPDPITADDRRWLARRRVQRLLASAAAGEERPLAMHLDLAMLGLVGKVRYTWGLAWPPWDVLLETYGRAGTSPGPATVATLRIRRLLRTLTAGRLG